MASVNRVLLLGNLGADPELKYTQSGKAVCNMSLATNEVWKDKQGQKQERVEWHRLVIYGDQAENCSKYLAKGRSVYVEGRIQTRKWEDKNGQQRYTTEIVVDRVVFLGGGDGTDGAKNGPSGGRRHNWCEGEQEMPSSRQAASPAASRPPEAPPGYGDDDIPF